MVRYQKGPQALLQSCTAECQYLSSGDLCWSVHPLHSMIFSRHSIMNIKGHSMLLHVRDEAFIGRGEHNITCVLNLVQVMACGYQWIEPEHKLSSMSK
jgi:hypothetical protein